MNDKNKEGGISAGVIDVVRVGAELCRTLEGCRESEAREFNDVVRGLLSLLYVKVAVLPHAALADGYVDPRVTEADYDYVRYGVATLLGADDSYLDVAVDGGRYSEEVVASSVGESLADVYQAVRNFLEEVRVGTPESVNVATETLLEEFEQHWGQRCLSALRALHDIRFAGERGEE